MEDITREVRSFVSSYCEPLVELAAAGPAPIASEALERIAGLYAIEHDVLGRGADERRVVRQDRSRPIIDELECHSACNFDPLSRGIGVQN